MLSTADSLAGDVEGEREERRSKRGYVEPRAARGFLALARMPLEAPAAEAERDALSRAYFRELGAAAADAPDEDATLPPLRDAWIEVLGSSELPQWTGWSDADPELSLAGALRLLRERNPRRFDARMEELSYLTNVLVAGALNGEHRFRPAEAGQAVLATVQRGAARSQAAGQSLICDGASESS